MKNPVEPTQETLLSRLRFGIILLLLAALVFLGAQILGPVILSAFALVMGVKGSHLTVLINDNVYIRFLLYLMIEALTVWGVYQVIRRRKTTWASIGIPRTPQWYDLGKGLIMYGIYFLIYLVVIMAVNASHLINTQQNQQLGFDNSHGIQLAFTFLSLVILPPIAEEVLFRGFIYLGLRRKFTVLQAGLVTSLLFGIAHLEFGSGTTLNWAAAIDTFTLSCVLCYITEKSRTLWPGMVVHATKNFVAFIALFLIK